MVNKTPWQLFRFAFVYLNAIPTGFLVTPLLWGSAYLGWMAILIGWGANLILLWFTVKVGRWDPDRSWIDFGQDLLGKWIHYPIILLILFWSVNYIGLDIEGFTLFFDTNYMRETPQWFIILIVGLVVTLTARWGDGDASLYLRRAVHCHCADDFAHEHVFFPRCGLQYGTRHVQTS